MVLDAKNRRYANEEARMMPRVASAEVNPMAPKVNPMAPMPQPIFMVMDRAAAAPLEERTSLGTQDTDAATQPFSQTEGCRAYDSILSYARAEPAKCKGMALH
eukprot:1320149-Amphidinium_carterae.2